MHAQTRVALATALLLGCTRTPPPTEAGSDRVWSDAQVFEYVRSFRDPHAGWSIPRFSVLGRHHGLELVQSVSCGDVIGEGDCSRVVYYDRSEDGRCAKVGGVMKKLTVHAGITSSTEWYCFPGVLVVHWQVTVPLMTPLEQVEYPCAPGSCRRD
jgi:hypothetical protein